MSPDKRAARATQGAWRVRGAESDGDVLNEVRAGNTALYEVLVQRHNPRLRRVARRVLSNDADVDEVIQEAHCSAFCAIQQFEGRSSFGTWLTRITLHAALTRLRHRACRLREWTPSEADSDYDPLSTVAAVQRNPEEQLLDKEALEALSLAVRALPEPYRTAFSLHWVRELSMAELAISLEVSEACAKSRLHRARRLLCSLLHARREAGGFDRAQQPAMV